MEMNRTKIIIYAVIHFLVDFSCAFLLFQKVHGLEQWYLCLLLYNFCAFALQMPIGLLADGWDRNAVLAASGCILVSLAYGFGGVPIAAAIAAGIGNGLFHIGGGIDVMNISGEKSGALGVFVSPGALGIYLGTLLGKQGGLSGYTVAAILLASAVTILAVQYLSRRSFLSGNVPVSLDGACLPKVLPALACFFLVVCLRSYVGMSINFSWKTQGYWGIILVSAVVFGKMAGGFLADKFGAVKISILTLGTAAVLFLFSAVPPAGIGAIFLFNMTMPVTLWAVSRIFKGSRGFSFGLLTFGLFLGFVPEYLGVDPLLTGSVSFALAALVSLPLLWAGLLRAPEGSDMRKAPV